MKMADSSPKGVENTAGKEEIARCEQFLLCSKCFLPHFLGDISAIFIKFQIVVGKFSQLGRV